MGGEQPGLRVLYIEDDHQVARVSVALLESLGVEVHVVPRGEIAVADIHRVRPDVVLLDIYQTDAESIELMRQLRLRSRAPIVLVHALGDLVTLVTAFVRKPDRIVVGPLQIDPHHRVVTLRGKPLVLTTSEVTVLLTLASQPGTAFSRDDLLHAIHGNAEDAFDRAIDVQISRIRAKLERDPKRPELLLTVRRAGYALARPETP